MKILSLLKKNIILQIRDYWALLITLSLGPFFVVIYWLITMGFPSYYNILVVNNDKGIEGKNINYGKDFIQMCDTDRRIIETMHIKLISSIDSGKVILKKRNADALIMIPENFSQVIQSKYDSLLTDRLKPEIYFYGEKSNTRYLVGVITSYTAIDEYIKYLTNETSPWNMVETFIDEEKIKRSDFELYVPGIFVLSIVMLLFSAGMIIIRDIEDKSIYRLKLTKMTVFDYVSGVTLTQILVGIISVVSTYVVAMFFGFRSLGTVFPVIAVSIIAFLGIIGITFIVVSFCKNATIFVIAGQFPLFILIFFTGAMMPIPRNPLFYIANNGICWNDFLPGTLAVTSLNSIFNEGSGIDQIGFQLIFGLLIAIIYLITGLYLFYKKHLKLQN